jgi:hypothetical protein
MGGVIVEIEGIAILFMNRIKRQGHSKICNGVCFVNRQ